MPGGGEANRGTANRGTENRGTANRGTANRGTTNRGTANRGTANRGTANRGTANRGTGTPTAAPVALAAPSVVAFPELAIGERATADIYAYNLDAMYEAAVQVSVVGSTAFAVRSAPTRLRPSHEGQSPPIVLAFIPDGVAPSRARLRIAATWQMNARAPVELFVELRGAAHAPGTMTVDEQAAQQRVDAEWAVAFARDARTAARLEQAWAKESTNPQPYPHRGQESALRKLYDEARDALDTIGDDQRVGIVTVDDEAKAFTRRVAQAESSVAMTLAFWALDAASAGLASNLTTAFSEIVRSSPATPRLFRPSELTTSTAQETFKVLFEISAADVAKAHTQAAFGPDAPEPAARAEAILYFFREQELTLNKVMAARRTALTRVYYGLMSGLRTDGHATLATMKRAVAALTSLHGVAAEVQAHHARLAWMSYLSQSAAGSRSSEALRRASLRPMPDGGPVTDLRALARTAPPGGKVAPVDGVLEVEIEASYRTPTRPVHVLGVRCTGITYAMLDAVMKHHGPRLRGLPLAIHAAGQGAGTEEFALCVAKDEAGNVGFTDNTSPPGRSSTWLAQKVGKWEVAAQHEGAKKLMDEVLDAPIDVRAMLWTDQA